MRSYTFPNAVTPDEGVGKPEAVKVPSALLRPTLVSSTTRYDGCIAIDTYPEIVDDRGRGLEFRIIKSRDVLLLTDQSLTRAGERIVIVQNLLKGLRVPLHPSSGHLTL